MKNNKVVKKEIEEVNCNEVIMSNEYSDLIVEYEGNISRAMEINKGICYQLINEKYAIIHNAEVPEDLASANLSTLPRLLGPYSVESLEASGILTFHTQPLLTLRGKNVIIGFIDSGIDYTQPTFIYEDRTTKIISIWDQTIQGNPPSGFDYGTEYDSLQIDLALESENPYDIVPSRDETGHGTFLASIAAGRFVEEGANVGAAPDAEIIMVKLKPAKDYLRNVYLVNEDAVVYEDGDIMLGIKYLLQKAFVYGRPLVICIGLGTNLGSHDGTSVLEEVIRIDANQIGVATVVCAGNEANLGHHIQGDYTTGNAYQEIEVRVAPNERGINIQLWSQTPDLYSVGLLSPTGEFITRVAARINTVEVIPLLLEQSVVTIYYQIYEKTSGDELVMIQIKAPTPGIWTLRIYGEVVVIGEYHLWMDREGWINPETQFLNPSPYMTITVPGTTITPITVGAYDHRTDSIYLGSGRGLVRDGEMKPDLVAPGVNVEAPLTNGQSQIMTGTSVAAAHVAGAAALLLEWGIVQGNFPFMGVNIVKKTLIRGADRKPQLIYPNREWGFGSLNLLNSFEIIRGRP